MTCRFICGEGEYRGFCRRKPNPDSLYCWQHCQFDTGEERPPPKVVEKKEVVTHFNESDSYDVFSEELMEVFGDISAYESIKAMISEDVEEECKHENCFDVENEGISICRGCGCKIEQFDFKPEWRFYGASDNRANKDPSRCHRAKDNNRGGIDKVFQDAKLMHLPLAIRKATEAKYKKIVGDNTVRGRGRKSIVAACLLYTYRHTGDIRTSDDIRTSFDLTKQEMSDGLTKYHEHFPEDRVCTITPKELIHRVFIQTKLDLSHYKYTLRIAKCLDGVDPVLNRSSPQSIASAIVYLYLCLNPELKDSLGYTKTKFARDVKLSDITITKLVKKSAEVLGIQLAM